MLSVMFVLSNTQIILHAYPLLWVMRRSVGSDVRGGWCHALCGSLTYQTALFYLTKAQWPMHTIKTSEGISWRLQPDVYIWGVFKGVADS